MPVTWSCLHFELSMTLNTLKAVKTSSLFYTTKVRSLIKCIRLNKVLNDLKHHTKILFNTDEMETGHTRTKFHQLHLQIHLSKSVELHQFTEAR